MYFLITAYFFHFPQNTDFYFPLGHPLPLRICLQVHNGCPQNNTQNPYGKCDCRPPQRYFQPKMQNQQNSRRNNSQNTYQHIENQTEEKTAASFCIAHLYHPFGLSGSGCRPSITFFITGIYNIVIYKDFFHTVFLLVFILIFISERTVYKSFRVQGASAVTAFAPLNA